jgi:micrococcal nuclease
MRFAMWRLPTRLICFAAVGLMIHGSICAGITSERGVSVTVIRVIDGDTLRVEFQGRAESVRLIGVDTPESRINKKARGDAERSGKDVAAILAMGKRATEFVRRLVKPGDILQLEFDVKERNHYRRLLAYVYLDDGRMLNEVIVREGYGVVMTVPPNVKYVDRFTSAMRESREAGRGLWSGDAISSLHN